MRRKRRICIVQFDSEAYSKHYIVQALFKLMGAYEYDKISVTDIANKAGVGRATFYRYFKRKEDVIVFYFEHNTREFVFTQRFEPRCREDYVSIAKNVFKLFKQSKEPLKLLKKPVWSICIWIISTRALSECLTTSIPSLIVTLRISMRVCCSTCPWRGLKTTARRTPTALPKAWWAQYSTEILQSISSAVFFNGEISTNPWRR